MRTRYDRPHDEGITYLIEIASEEIHGMRHHVTDGSSNQRMTGPWAIAAAQQQKGETLEEQEGQKIRNATGV